MWPAALVGAFAVFFGAIGSGSVQTTYAADGDICSIQDADGTELLHSDDLLVLEVGESADIRAVFEDTGLTDFSVDVNLDENTADAAITSHDNNGDGDTDPINPTNHLNSIETQAVDEDLCGIDGDSFPGLDEIRDILVSAAEDGENCIPNYAILPASVCGAASPGDFNPGDQNPVPGGFASFNDFDIDCAVDLLGGPCEAQASSDDFTVASAIILEGLTDGDTCGAIGADVNDALIDTGTDEFIAFQFDDFVSDACGEDVFDDIDLDDAGDDSELLIDVTCYEPGSFILSFAPEDGSEAGSIEVLCGGQAETAEISASPATVEINPVGTSVSSSTIKVTVDDIHGDRVDGIWVALTTDNCTFKVQGDSFISPAAGGTTVDIKTDTDATGPDQNFLNDNPSEMYAGTAEAILDCSTSAASAGVANIEAVVQRPGSDIVLETTVTVVGQAAANGLTLTLTPDDDFDCGDTILAVANAVDVEGQPVSNGTIIYFTTDTSTGVQGGVEGAQGSSATVGGEASVLIATDPGNPGLHTVIAYTMNAAGNVNAQTSTTYTCDGAVAPAAPTVSVPNTGTGTGSITPPNTGDAGLASASSSASLFVIAGAAFVILASIAGFKFAREQ